MIRISNLSKIYAERCLEVKALDGINLTIDDGEFVALTGQSGSGKSTLLHILGGVDVPTGGEVMVDKIDINRLNDDELSDYRNRKIGFIFQAFNLIPILNVEQNIELPCRIGDMKIDEDLKTDLIELLNLEDRLEHLPSELSGGQQQRVAIARALLAKPSIILADEPTGNLDSKNSREVIEILKKINQKYNKTIIIVTHDDKIASQTNRIIELKDGEIIKDEVQ